MTTALQSPTDENPASPRSGSDTRLSESTAVPEPPPGAVPPEMMPEISPGIALAGLLVMTTAAGSLAVLSRWAARWKRSGHAITAANRPMLRVPSAVAFATAAVSILFAWYALTIETPDVREPAKSGESTDILEPGAVESGNSQDPESPDSPAPVAEGSDDGLDTPAADPEPTMHDLLFGTLQMNAALFLIFGSIVLVANLRQGKARVATATFAGASGFDSPLADEDTPQFADFSNPQAVMFTDAGSGNPEASPVATASEPFCLRTELRIAAEVCLAAYTPTIAMRLLVVFLMKQFGGEIPPSHPFLEMLDSDGGGIVLLVALTAVVVAPIVEELQYRVVLLGGLAQTGMTWPALVLSSVLFSLAHGIPDGIALIPLALALGYAYLRRKSYLTVILVHFLFNAFNLLVAFLGMM